MTRSAENKKSKHRRGTQAGVKKREALRFQLRKESRDYIRQKANATRLQSSIPKDLILLDFSSLAMYQSLQRLRTWGRFSLPKRVRLVISQWLLLWIRTLLLLSNETISQDGSLDESSEDQQYSSRDTIRD